MPQFSFKLCVLYFQRFCAQVYNQCKSSDEKILLLSNLLIRRGAGITSTTRRVGPELSKRLYLTMNSCDPEQVLESNPWLLTALSFSFLCTYIKVYVIMIMSNCTPFEIVLIVIKSWLHVFYLLSNLIFLKIVKLVMFSQCIILLPVCFFLFFFFD